MFIQNSVIYSGIYLFSNMVSVFGCIMQAKILTSIASLVKFNTFAFRIAEHVRLCRVMKLNLPVRFWFFISYQLNVRKWRRKWNRKKQRRCICLTDVETYPIPHIRRAETSTRSKRWFVGEYGAQERVLDCWRNVTCWSKHVLLWRVNPLQRWWECVIFTAYE